MDDKARLQLQKMIKANNVEDQTKLIRELKENPLFYKNYSERSRERAKELDPVRQLDEFQKWIQEISWS